MDSTHEPKANGTAVPTASGKKPQNVSPWGAATAPPKAGGWRRRPRSLPRAECRACRPGLGVESQQVVPVEAQFGQWRLTGQAHVRPVPVVTV
jgi:hypothetical protein